MQITSNSVNYYHVTVQLLYILIVLGILSIFFKNALTTFLEMYVLFLYLLKSMKCLYNNWVGYSKKGDSPILL